MKRSKPTESCRRKPAAGKQTIFRSAARHKPYAQLGNTMLRDARISFAARGLLCFLLSYPSTWKFGPTWLCKNQRIGRDRFYNLINELMEAGYCVRLRSRRANGTLGPFEYVFSDEPAELAENLATPPRPEKPDVAQPDVAEPDLANPYTKKTESNEDRKKDGNQRENLSSGRGENGVADATHGERSFGKWGTLQ